MREHRRHLSVAVKLAYAIGALSDSIKTFGFTTFLLFFYTTVMGLRGTLLGLAMSIGLVWDAAIDPLIGHLSDRSTARFGRRHAFMLAGAIAAGAGFVAVFNPPSSLSSAGLFAWLMAASLCVRSGNSLFMVPYSALGAELPRNYHERTSVAGYRAGAVLVGTMLVTQAAFLVFLPDRGASGTDAKFAAHGYRAMGVAFGIAMIAAGLVATLGTIGERTRMAAPPSTGSEPFTLRRRVAGTMRDRRFRVLMWAGALSLMASAINAALAVHFLTYHARVSANGAISLYYQGFYVGAMAGVFCWVRVARQVRKHRIYVGTTIAAALLISAGYWLIGEGRILGTGRAWTLVAGNALVGFFGIAGAVLVPSMIADITARDADETGHRRDGLFFGVFSFGQQIAGGLAVLVAGVLLDQFAFLAAGQAQQSAATIERLAMISNLLPAVVMLGASAVMSQYGDRAEREAPVELPGMAAAGRSPDSGETAHV